MNEQNLPSLGDITEAAKTIKEVLPESVKEIDGIISTFTGLLNHVVLDPAKRLNLHFQYKLESFKRDLAKRIEPIPLEHIQEPNLLIAGPAIEALKYTIDEPTLRDMFINLLAASVDQRMNNACHPAFVEIIKQLSPLDAKFLNIFCNKGTYPCISVTIKHSNGKLTPFLHDTIDLLDNTPFFEMDEYVLLTAVLDNLLRLGIVIKNTAIIEDDYNYDSLKDHWHFQSYMRAMKEGDELIIIYYRIELTEFGRSLKKCCLDD
jgi:hypothetical protein